MAIVNKKSAFITAADNDKFFSSRSVRGALTRSAGYVDVDADNSANSTYRLARVKSNDVITNLFMYNTALPSGSSYKVGIYDINDGAAVDDDLFASGISLVSARTTPIDLRFSTLNINTIEKAIWEIMGLSSYVDKEYDLVVTAVTPATATGVIGIATIFAG